jgi:hypothetical protein
MRNTPSPGGWTILSAGVGVLFVFAGRSLGTSAPVPSPESVQPTPPAPAQHAGYLVRTYGPNPTLVTSTSSAANTAGLFAWGFAGQALGGSASPNSDGSISIIGGNAGTNAQVASATSGAAAGSFNGIAFGGGGYFEAVLKFYGWQHQSENPNSQSGGWPAFWGMAVEHLARNGAAQVPRQTAGFENFIEMDFMEYNIENTQSNDTVYSGSLINWYGVWGQSCSSSGPRYCNIMNSYASKIRQLPAAVNFSDYHAYGALWIPATDSSDGSIRWYFDGVQIGQTVTWVKLTNPSAMPPSPFAIGDLQHLAIMLGTGSQYPMTVSSVSVWQKSTANNLVH